MSKVAKTIPFDQSQSTDIRCSATYGFCVVVYQSKDLIQSLQEIAHKPFRHINVKDSILPDIRCHFFNKPRCL